MSFTIKAIGYGFAALALVGGISMVSGGEIAGNSGLIQSGWNLVTLAAIVWFLGFGRSLLRVIA